MRRLRNIIEINEELCNGCGDCALSCAEAAIRIVDGKARLVSETFCDGLGACLGDCPTGALKIVQREAEDFDEGAVKTHQTPPQSHHACPGSQIRRFDAAHADSLQAESRSALTHWPVQIRLAPPNAPFLQGAHLLVVADCVPISYPNFHRDFLAGRVVLVGCPKFDDVDLYVQRFADMFRASDIKSVMVVVMQVPCCQGLPMVVKEGMRQASKSVPTEKIVITLEGAILRRETLVA